jgi:hypothetical protein
MTSDMSAVVFDELVSSDRFRVFWGFLWRALLITVASTLGGAITGFVLGLVLGVVGDALGWSADSVRTGASILGGLGGLVVGLFFFWLYIKWLFGAKWSGYQLRLVRTATSV